MDFLKTIIFSMLAVFCIGNGEDVSNATSKDITIGWICWIIVFAISLVVALIIKKCRKNDG